MRALASLSFLAPLRLLLLLGVLGLVAAYVVQQRRRRTYAVRFTNLALLDAVAPRRPGWRRHVPAAAFLAMLSLLVLGFARPTADVRVPRERATVMVAVDTSASMQATDVAPDRLSAAKDAAGLFVERLPDRFNVGLVAFAGNASVIVAPTTDHTAVRAGIERLQLGPRTAIGEAIFTSLDAIATFDDPAEPAEQSGTAEREPPPARIVLLSDGENTTGRLPEDAAAAALAAEVPVSTIAYGTPDGSVETGGVRVPVPVDAPTLEGIAEATGGRFYEAASGEELRDVYDDIGSSVGFRLQRQEVSAWFIGLALLAGLGAAVASLLWFSRLP